MTVDETLARLKALYFETTQATIEDAFDEAIDLLKTLPSEADRQRAARVHGGPGRDAPGMAEREKAQAPLKN